MALEPGLLTDLNGQSQLEWDDYVKATIEKNIIDSNTIQYVSSDDSDLLPDIVPIDWSGYPARIRECLQSELKTDKLLDWVVNGKPKGRFGNGHEEYLEWRTVRDSNGKITKIEFTTELLEYWYFLAKHNPHKTLRIIGNFAGESIADSKLVYGNIDPFTATPNARARGFQEMMFSINGEAPKSPYNDGTKAITFMANSVNTMSAAVGLAAYAAFPYVKIENGAEVPLTGREAIKTDTQAAQDCRNSDPTIVENVIKFANQRRKIALHDPIGLYISSINHENILLPDESDSIPLNWFDFQRGVRPTINGGLEMSQRLVFEVPSTENFVIGDLIDADSGRNIDYGAQIAKLVNIVLYAKASEENLVTHDSIIKNIGTINQCSDEPACNSVKSKYDEFEMLEKMMKKTPETSSLTSPMTELNMTRLIK